MNTTTGTNGRELTLPISQPSHTFPAKQAEISQTTAQTLAQSHTAVARLFFLDNLRWALTILVILHHMAITYGAEGSWYYVEQPTDLVASMILTLFAGLNQGYFMGLFFLVAGYFVPASLDRKGTWRFLQDRAIRLGLPLILYALFVSPVLNGFEQIYLQGGEVTISSLWSASLAQWQRLNFSPGPLWFVETLLIFSGIYALGTQFWRGMGFEQAGRTPIQLTTFKLLSVVVVIASVSFATRLVYPIGTEWNHLQLAFFPQYLALFAAGVMAYRNQWLPKVPTIIFRSWTAIALLAILALPAMMMLPGVQEDFETVMGGWHWNSLFFSIWEAFYAVAMSITLLGLFRLCFNKGSAFSRILSADAYAVYVIHAPILITLTYAVRGLAIHPLLKFGLLATPAVVITFALAHILVGYVPGVKRVLQ